VTTNAKTAALEALIEAHAIELKLPTVRHRFRALADEALREQQTPVAYLGALLEAEMADGPNGARSAASTTRASRPSSASRTSASPPTRTSHRPRSPRSSRAPGSTTASR
jgi:hypothetical protein